MRCLQKVFSILYEIAGTKNLHLAMMILILIFLLFTKTINSHIIKGTLTPLSLPIVDTSIDLNYIEVITYSVYEPISGIYFCIIVFIIGLLIYLLLYKWRSLPITFKSASFFLVNYAILILYSISFIMLIQGIPSPIYIEDLSLYSQYKYLFFAIVGFIIASLFLANFLASIVNSHLKRFLSLISYPYLYEETVKILSTWEATFWGPFFDVIITKINTSKGFRYVFFITHGLLSFLIPLIVASLFLYIVIVHGDLRYLIYILPVSFITWFYRHISYYFFTFMNINFLAIREYLEITILGKNMSLDTDIVCYNTEDICFTLSQKALDDFSSEYDHNVLLQNFQKDFVRLGQCHTYILRYQKKSYYMGYLLFGIRYLAWLKLSIFFFYLQDNILAVNFLLTKFGPKMTFIRPYATKAYYVNKGARPALEAATKGAYHGNHPVTTDVDLENTQGEVPFKHQPTHGSGPANNPSKLLSNQVDLEGNAAPQKAVYPDPALGTIFFPKKALGKEIPGSESFYKQPDVQANDKANTE